MNKLIEMHEFELISWRTVDDLMSCCGVGMALILTFQSMFDYITIDVDASVAWWHVGTSEIRKFRTLVFVHVQIRKFGNSTVLHGTVCTSTSNIRIGMYVFLKVSTEPVCHCS